MEADFIDVKFWVFTLVGVTVLGIACLSVARGISVTSGQAMIFAFGAAMIALPHIVDFEWSETGFKFTTKETTSRLASSVKLLSDQQGDLNKQITVLRKAIGDSEAQLNEVLAKIESSQNSVQLPKIDTSSSSIWEGFLERGELIDKTSQDTIMKIDNIQKSLSSDAR